MTDSEANPNSPLQVVFIDSNVPDIADLLSGLAPGEVAFVINPGSDGVQQIANILAANNLTNLSSISIVGHGASGAIDLGSTVLNDGDLASHASALAQIGAALAPGGDLQLYSCNTASGASGRQFIADLSSYVGGATVAASTQDIGETETGENWTLDALAGPAADRSGSIAAPTQVANPFTAKAEAQFSGTLTVATSEVWIVGSAGQDLNTILHDDDTGTHTESNQGELFTATSANDPSTANNIDRLDMIRLDTQSEKYFIAAASEGAAPTELLEGSLSSVLANPTATPTYTTLWTDTSSSRSSNELSGLAVDPASQQVFFVDGTSFYKNSYNGNTGTVTTLDNTGSVPIEGLALDLPDHVAYFIHSFQTNTTTTTKNGVVLTSAPSPITANEHVHHNVTQANSIYETSSLSASSTSVSIAKLMDVSSNLGAMAALGTPGFTVFSQPGNSSNPLNGKIFFTTQTIGGTHPAEGGIFEVDPSTHAITTLFRQDGVHGPTGTLTSLQIDYASNQYYVTVINTGGTGGTVWVGNLSGGTPTQFDTLASQPDNPTPFDLSVDVAPTLAITPTNPTFTESALNPASAHNTPVALITGATASDSDNTELVSAQVSIGGFFAGDTLSFSNNHSITGSYNSSTGVLTFSGEDTFADYQTALATVQFTSTSDNPTDYGSDTTRTLGWTVNDGLISSAVQNETVTIVGVNDPPTLSSVASNASYTEEGSFATLASSLSVVDVDDLDLKNATVQITGGTFANDGDVLAATTAGTSITASYDSTTETLTLTGTDTLAHYQSVLDSVTFHAGENPTNFGSNTTRTLTWVAQDPSGTALGGQDTSSISTTTLTVNNVNDPPTLSNVTTSAQFTEEGAAVTLSPSVTVTDPDDLDLTSATVKITGGTFANDGDVLAATTTGTSITASYNSTSETLTLTGTDTLANYQSVLDTVTFNAGENPTDFGSNTTRTITWVAHDPSGTANGGSDTSSASTTTLSVTNVNDPPTFSNVATSAHFTEGGGAVVLSNAAAVTDPDNLDLASATVSITTGTFTGDGDVLAANGVSNGTISQGGGNTITVSYNSSTETLILSGSDTLAHYQTLLDEVSFNSTSLNPTDYGSITTHQVTWVLNDGSGSNNLSSPIATTTVSLTAVNNPPTLTGTTNASYTELAAAVKVSPSVTVADPDNLDLVGATVVIAGGTFANDGDVLAATTSGTSITASYNSTNETLTLTGSDTLANYQSVLDTVTFADPGNHNPTDFGADPTRTVTWVLNDGVSSNNLSTTQTSTISITAVNDPPTLSNVASGVTEAPSVTVTLSNAVSVTDPDNLNLAGATVSITGGTFASDGDVLAAVATGNVTVSYNSTSETLILTGSDTLAHYQSVLDTVTFDNASANPTNGGADPTRTISWVLNDGSGSNNLSTAQFTTVTLQQGPIVGPAATVTWTEEGPSTTLSPSIALSDTNGTVLVSATVSLASGDIANGTFAPFGQLTNDQLAFSTSGTSITASYNSATETLLLTGSDTLAHYQSVLDTVAFSSGENPTNYGSDPTRIVTWTVNDGAASHSSATATSTIDVNNVNDPPTLASVAASVAFTEGAGSVSVSPSIKLTDPDDLTLGSATVQISGGTFANDGDVLATDTTGLAVTASYNSTSETLILTGTDTLADYQHVLDSVTFNSTSLNPTNFGADPTRTITWIAVDPSGTANGGVNSVTATTTVDITAVNNPPTLANVATSASFVEEGAAVTLSSSVTVSDPDNLSLVGATVSITSGAFANDVLAATTSGTSITASYNSTSETLILSGSDTLAHYQSVLDTVTFNAGENPTDFGADPSRTVTWVLNDGSTSNNLSTAVTSTIGVTNVNDPPTLSNVATGAHFTQGGGAVVLSNAVSVSDPDNLDLVGATVSITTGTFAGDGDVLAANVSGTSITASYNSTTETLTLSGSDTLAHYQSVLDTVSFNSTSLNPTDFGSVSSHQVTWVLNDGSGSSNLSTAATTTVSLTGVNEIPTLSNVATSAHFTEEGGAVTLSSSVSVTDADNLDLVSATVSITSGAFTGDLLAAVPTGNITVSYNSTSETLILTGSDTLAHYQSVLDTVTFNAGENPTGFGADPARTVTWVLNNGGSSNNLSTAVTTTIGVTNVNDPPTLSNVATGAHFTQGAGAVVLSNAASVSDPDNLNLAGATVSITTGTFVGDGDVLTANTSGTSVTASYNSTTETLLLSGADTLAHYQSVLDSVSFNSTSLNPSDYGSVLAHQVVWLLNDGSASNNVSTAATTTVTITPVHQPPTLASVAASDTLPLNQTITLSPHAAVSDPDNLTIANATLALTGGTFAGDGDVLAANVSGTSITASYNSTSETLTLTGSDTLANYTSVLDSVTFSSGPNPSNSGLDPTRTLTWTVNDGAASNNIASATTTITVSVPTKNDFNGDHTSDIAFQDVAPPTSGGGGRGHGTSDPTSGDAQIFLINNGTVSAARTLSAPGSNAWRIVGSGDFNGDGNADIVWQNTSTGAPMIWTMNGTTYTSTTTLASPGSSWTADAVGDFNGDGHPDILFQNVDGTPMIDTMNGTSITAQTLLPDPGASWHVVAAADFNGDGKSDIVFQNTDGTPQVWLMNGTSITAAALLTDPGSNFKLVGAADFNHDGDADLLFQNTSTGAPVIWTMNGTSVTSQTTLAAAGSSLTLVGAGNYFGGTQPDLLFQNASTGAPVIWTMSGTSVTGSTTLASPGGSNWHANTG